MTSRPRETRETKARQALWDAAQMLACRAMVMTIANGSAQATARSKAYRLRRVRAQEAELDAAISAYARAIRGTK